MRAIGAGASLVFLIFGALYVVWLKKIICCIHQAGYSAPLIRMFVGVIVIARAVYVNPRAQMIKHQVRKIFEARVAMFSRVYRRGLIGATFECMSLRLIATLVL